MLAIRPDLETSLRHGGAGLRIALIRLGAMGDIFRVLPALQALRRSLPEADLTWIVDAHWKLLIDGHPSLNRIVGVPRKELDRARRSPAGWGDLLRLLADLRKRTRQINADLVIDFHGNLRSGLLAWWTDAALRLGYDGHQQKECNRWFLNLRLASGGRRISRVDRNLALVEALGIATATDSENGLLLPQQGREEADAIRSEIDGQRYAVISPGASQAQTYKRPPVDVLVACCRRLHDLGVQPLVQFGPGEEPDAQAVVTRAEESARLCPPTSIAGLASLTKGATMFVGGDSGPLHLACAVGCPVVGLYGPTDPVVNEPWGTPYRVVKPAGRQYTGIKRQDRIHGFEGLAANAAVTAIEELLRETTDPSTTV